MLAIVTPSYINNPQRAEWAKKSLASLGEAVGRDYLHVVVLDKSNTPEWDAIAQAIYIQPNIRLVQPPEHLGGARALLRAIRESRKQGADLCLIHLDDCVYVPELGQLLLYSQDAFERDEELMQIRLAGYPILTRYCTAEKGNLAQVEVRKDEILFDGIHLKPSRTQSYTLWLTRFQDRVIESRCWPICLWQAVYRAEYLEEVLSQAIEHGREVLGRVEVYWRYRANWPKSWLSMKLGFINMQFGGFEMHRNADCWGELIRFPNIAVR